jgi:DNA recombination protein Rad52
VTTPDLETIAAELEAQRPERLPQILETLLKPLDPARVKKRQGRGSGQFSYLETHDVKRTMNTIFGFDGWGYEIVQQEEIARVDVEKDNRQGCHVGYRCIIRLSCRGFLDTDGSGYGDAVEYGQAARVTASELAIKESESDALKRACVKLGDQFGLGLYDKDAPQSARSEPEDHRIEQPRPKTPRSWADLERGMFGEHPDEAWKIFLAALKDVVYHQWGLLSQYEGRPDRAQLSKEQKDVLWQKALGAYLWLHDNVEADGPFTIITIDDVRRAFASVLGGHRLEIPDYVPPEPPEPDVPDEEAARIADETISGPPE